MRSLALRSRQRTNKGFNLIEAAIVLGIVGLVVGGIWVAATSVYANLRSKQATDQLLKITQSVRALYATSSTTGYTTATDITAFMAQANVLPSDTLTLGTNSTTSANTTNAWGGQIGVIALATGTQFGVVFSNVPPAACVDLVMRNAAGAARDAGLTTLVGAATATPSSLPSTRTQALTSGSVLTLTNAQTVCASAATALANINIGFVFNLKS
jgi:Tfp pilus assembly protein PilE